MGSGRSRRVSVRELVPQDGPSTLADARTPARGQPTRPNCQETRLGRMLSHIILILIMSLCCTYYPSHNKHYVLVFSIYLLTFFICRDFILNDTLPKTEIVHLTNDCFLHGTRKAMPTNKNYLFQYTISIIHKLK